MVEEKKYKLSEESEHDKATKKLDEITKIPDTKKWDESNPLERAKKFQQVKANPPEPGYMKVEVFKETDSNGNPIVVSKSTDDKRTVKEVKHNPIFTIDLNTLITADVAACPSNVVPMLIDQAVQLAMNEKKTFKPEKRKEMFNWWWIVMALLMIPGIILIVLLFIGGG